MYSHSLGFDRSMKKSSQTACRPFLEARIRGNCGLEYSKIFSLLGR